MIGQRVYLRILEQSDLPTTQKWISDPEFSKIIGYLPTKSLKQQEQWYDTNLNDNSRYIFAICLRDNHEHIGNVALGRIDYVSRNAMYSIFIYEKDYRSKGYGSEATRLILDFGFKQLNLHKIYLQVSQDNDSAIRMYESLGFVWEGTQREHFYSDGKYVDKYVYSILKREYEDYLLELES